MQCCFGDDTSSEQKSRCCSVSSDCDPNSLPMPPGPPTSRPPRPDFETLSEKYWGEILERTVSSSSLQALQRTYGQHHPHHPHQTELSVHKANVLELNGSHHQTVNLSNFSSSEPRLCEHFRHDINCAKSKALFRDRHAIKAMPNI